MIPFTAQALDMPDAAAPEPSTDRERAQEQLQRLCTYFQAQLTELTWPSEEARWMNLAACLLEECAQDLEPLLVREAVAQLQFLGLVDIATLASVAKRWITVGGLDRRSEDSRAMRL